MNIIEKYKKHISRFHKHANALGIDPESCSTELGYKEIEQVITILEWAEKAAAELASHTTLVDWYSNSKELSEQVDGNNAIGYEWCFWHTQQDEGRAAGERIVTLFDEYRALTERSE